MKLVVCLLFLASGCGKGLNPTPSLVVPTYPQIISITGLVGGDFHSVLQFNAPMDTSGITTTTFTSVYAIASNGTVQVTQFSAIGPWSAGNTLLQVTHNNFLPASGTFYVEIGPGRIATASGITNVDTVRASQRF